MNLLKNIKVKVKLIVAFLIVAFLIGIVGSVGIVSLKDVDNNSHQMYTNNLRSVYILTDMKQNLTQMKSDLLQLTYVKEASQRQSLEKDINENKDENDQYIDEYKKIPMNEQEKKIYSQFESYLQQYSNSKEDIVKVIDLENLKRQTSNTLV